MKVTWWLREPLVAVTVMGYDPLGVGTAGGVGVDPLLLLPPPHPGSMHSEKMPISRSVCERRRRDGVAKNTIPKKNVPRAAKRQPE